MPGRRSFALLALLLSLGLGLGRVAAEDPALPPRVPGAVRLAGNPDGLGRYEVVEAFPKLSFELPVWVGSAGDGTDRVFVAERDGLVKSFENASTASKVRVCLDLTKSVLRSHNEEGLLGMAFHPGFKKNGLVYVSYSADDPRRTVVSRFTATGSRLFVRPNTEEVVIQERQPEGGNNGGWLAFGNDGFLYVAFGDGGLGDDERGYAQDLDNRLGKVLRLDVGEGKTYSVPQDNPFVLVRGARPEVWASGFRSARRFSFDPVTGDLWLADSGWERVEEIDVVAKGGNYGWNLREGAQVHKEGASLVPLLDPVLEIPREEARMITGGVVYRGKQLPELNGAYVYGDLETGNLWALRWDGSYVKENVLIGRGVQVTAFGTDEAGELLLAALDGKVYRLQAGEAPAETFPTRLSATGLFQDVKTLTPNPALIPYSVNVPLWSDGAVKERWVMLPGEERVRVAKDGKYEYPVGTIFVKHFGLAAPEGTPHRLETRLFAHTPQGWAGYTYVWNDTQDDAILIDGRVEKVVQTGSEGERKDVPWTFPSRSDCMSCHTAAAGYVLGFRTPQLNRKHAYAGAEHEQLDALARMGVFDGKVSSKGEAFPDWASAPAGDEAAIRAYLDANCAMCHQPGGPGNANIDLRFDTPLKQTNLVDQRPGQWDLGIYGARLLVPGSPEKSLLHARMSRTDVKGMPPVGHNTPDAKALESLADWIRKLK